MQISKLFTVYDQKAEVFLPPFFVPTNGIATRAFRDCVNSEDHQFGKHPSDYTLFYLGDFDDSTAEFDLGSKISLGNGVEFLDPDNPDSLGDFPNDTRDSPIQSDENSGDSA